MTECSVAEICWKLSIFFFSFFAFFLDNSGSSFVFHRAISQSFAVLCGPLRFFAFLCASLWFFALLCGLVRNRYSDTSCRFANGGGGRYTNVISKRTFLNTHKNLKSHTKIQIYQKIMFNHFNCQCQICSTTGLFGPDVKIRMWIGKTSCVHFSVLLHYRHYIRALRFLNLLCGLEFCPLSFWKWIL